MAEKTLQERILTETGFENHSKNIVNDTKKFFASILSEKGLSESLKQDVLEIEKTIVPELENYTKSVVYKLKNDILNNEESAMLWAEYSDWILKIVEIKIKLRSRLIHLENEWDNNGDRTMKSRMITTNNKSEVMGRFSLIDITSFNFDGLCSEENCRERYSKTFILTINDLRLMIPVCDKHAEDMQKSSQKYFSPE